MLTGEPSVTIPCQYGKRRASLIRSYYVSMSVTIKIAGNQKVGSLIHFEDPRLNKERRQRIAGCRSKTAWVTQLTAMSDCFASVGKNRIYIASLNGDQVVSRSRISGYDIENSVLIKVDRRNG
jgi:hypothetical protein